MVRRGRIIGGGGMAPLAPPNYLPAQDMSIDTVRKNMLQKRHFLVPKPKIYINSKFIFFKIYN